MDYLHNYIPSAHLPIIILHLIKLKKLNTFNTTTIKQFFRSNLTNRVSEQTMKTNLSFYNKFVSYTIYLNQCSFPHNMYTPASIQTMHARIHVNYNNNFIFKV